MKWFSREVVYYLSIFTQIGFTMVFNILACLFLYRLFSKIGWEHPLVLFLCILLGIGNGYYQIYRLIFRKK